MPRSTRRWIYPQHVFSSRLLVVAACLGSARAQTGYVVDTIQDRLYSIDLTAGAVTSIGSTANNGLSYPGGLAWRSDLGQLWVVDFAGGAVGPLDVTSGAFTPVLRTNRSGWQGITWDAAQGLFFLANQDDFTYTLDPVTGMLTRLGNSGAILISALDTDSAGVHWGISFGGAIVEIDPLTGIGTQRAVTAQYFQGLAITTAGVWYAVNTATYSLYTIDPVTGTPSLVGPMAGAQFTKGLEIPTGNGPGTVGAPYCTAQPNSTGAAGAISASGSASVAANNLALSVSSLPTHVLGVFLTSRTQGLIANPGGSQGNLCLGGTIGTYAAPGQIKNSGTTGSFSLALDLAQMPTPAGQTAVVVGDTWNFTAWFRDGVGGSATSNFTNGRAVTFN